MGTARTREPMSAADWQSSSPRSPISSERIHIAGMKNSPCRDSDRIVARTALPMVCSIILLMVVHEKVGKVIH